MATRPVTTWDVLDGHVTLDLQCLDRIYLNGYVPNLQVGGQIVQFLAGKGFPIPSPAVVGRIGDRFREAVRRLADTEHIPVVRFAKHARKLDVMRPYLHRQAATKRSGIAAIGVAQEFQWVASCGTRPARGAGAPHFAWGRAERRVSCFYFYLWDEEFGPAFIKICSYLPYPVGQGCVLASPAFERIARPSRVDGRRAPALRFGDPRVMALAGALAVSSNLIRGFSNKTIRPLIGDLLGEPYSQARCCYDLRRLKLKGLIRKVQHTNTYVLTADGQRFAIFYTKIGNRVLRPLMAADQIPAPLPVRQSARQWLLVKLAETVGNGTRILILLHTQILGRGSQRIKSFRAALAKGTVAGGRSAQSVQE